VVAVVAVGKEELVGSVVTQVVIHQHHTMTTETMEMMHQGPASVEMVETVGADMQLLALPVKLGVHKRIVMQRSSLLGPQQMAQQLFSTQ
jgi:predicted metal-dependent TIM-barrel fold hydrolase